MLRIEMLPAARGDCLWLDYGPPEAPRTVVVDGGVQATAGALRAKLAASGRRRLELLVVTHIDLDHIAGVLELLRDPPPGLEIADVWFNDYRHLPDDAGVLGARQGESLAAWIEQRGLPWNAAFGGGPVAVAPEAEEPPRRTLAGGLRLTVLGPTRERLRRLRGAWAQEVRALGLEPGRAGRRLEGLGHPDEAVDPGVLGAERLDLDELLAEPFAADASVANGSSIALLAEYETPAETKRVVLAGDAFAGDLEAGVRRLIPAGAEALEVGALKLSHHGGRKNTSAALLEVLACPRFLVSTDGSYYDHPHAPAIARVLRHGRRAGEPLLCFNYRSEESERWDDRGLRRRERYRTVYPGGDGPGLAVEL
jgi:glyoxylase-like metal-dependent hydrolase (beta-lactamase superfamily II)